MKRIFAIVAAVALCFVLTVPAFAAEYDDSLSASAIMTYMLHSGFEFYNEFESEDAAKDCLTGFFADALVLFSDVTGLPVADVKAIICNGVSFSSNGVVTYSADSVNLLNDLCHFAYEMMYLSSPSSGYQREYRYFFGDESNRLVFSIYDSDEVYDECPPNLKDGESLRILTTFDFDDGSTFVRSCMSAFSGTVHPAIDLVDFEILTAPVLSSSVPSESLTGALGEVTGMLAVALPVVAGLFGIRKGIAFLISRVRSV